MQDGYGGVRYAGFWLRVAAYLIDFLVLAVAGFVIGAVFGGIVGGVMGANGASAEEITSAVRIPSFILGLVINLLYFGIMESSARQATLGKMLVGVIVTDMEGQRLSFANAIGRYLGKILSALILGIGFIMVAFTERKQGLHDMVASTLVVHRA